VHRYRFVCGLLVAMSARGLGRSLRTIAGLGWRHAAALGVTTATLFGVATFGLAVLGS
jgi:hypothetical protein